MRPKDRVELNAGAAGAELRSGVRLSKTRGGERTWQLSLAIGSVPAELRSAIRALRQIDDELERAYSGPEERSAPRVHVPQRVAADEAAGRSTHE